MTGNHLVDRDILQLLFVEALQSNMQDFQRLTNLCHLLMQCESKPGDIVEFGCNNGKTAALLGYLTEKKVWLYDSFEGLPEPSEKDKGRAPNFVKGKLACTRDECAQRIVSAGLQGRVGIIQAWFNQLTEHLLPKSIAFAHVDADFYNGTWEALDIVYPRLTKGGIVVIDDYGWSGLPGVEKAVNNWFGSKGIRNAGTRQKMLGYKAPAHQIWFEKI